MLDVIGVALVQIYEFNDSETGQTYLWNATVGRQLAEARMAEIVPIHLADVGMTRAKILEMAPDLDQQKALRFPGVALLTPILFVPHNGKHVCIDGWHRIFKAVVQGFPVLPAYILTEEEERLIRVGGG